MSKGKNFEREISVLISLWLTNGDHDDYVWHTGSSGARGTVRKKLKKSAENSTIGDLAAEHDDVKWFFNFFSIELKTGYPKSKRKSKITSHMHIHNWSLTDLLDGAEKKTTFLKFWDQSIEDANKSKREPMLIFRRNNKQACICMAKDIFETIQYNIKPPKLVIDKIILYPRFYMPVSICNLKDFLRLTKKRMNKEIILKCTSILKCRDSLFNYKEKKNG